MENAPKVTYWACWWRATWVIYLIVCLMGFAGFETQPWAPLTANAVTLLACSAVLVTLGIAWLTAAAG